MSISYSAENKSFQLDTPNTSYVMGIQDSFGYLLHYYYGKRINATDISYLSGVYSSPYTPERNNRDKLSFLDCAPFEYPTGGVGDFREHCLEVRTVSGHNGIELSYKSHTIYSGKKPIQGLPAVFANDEECDSLEIVLADEIIGLQVILQYSAFRNLDVITRSVKIINQNSDREHIYLTKVLSSCLDMQNQDFSMLTLNGSWARERRMQYRKIGIGRQGTFSERGETSHQEHPFAALTTSGISQTNGEVYASHLVYSGNFEIQTGVNQFDSTRTVVGINPYHFSWKLNYGEEFQTPEVIMVYSANGLGHMTRTFHKLYTNHLIRSRWLNKERPVLINNWEGTYFDFTTEKLLTIASEASKLGIELFVLDDGWFGNRFDDNRSLGDWYVNREKLPGGLKYLSEQINKMGMKFGIWMEPEMISPDSDLFREHPDWAIQIPGRTPGLARNQLVLDITRAEVLEYVWKQICNTLDSATISYLKWDMNRPLADIGSLGLTSDCQGEFYHRYVLAVYELQERLVQKYPDLLLENCSGGGARFDPGMLYYSPQIWCSDDTDAIERLSIQEGTALIYPLSTIGAHVSACPNHAVGRVTPMETRGNIALFGTFGYELDPTKFTDEEKETVRQQINDFHKYNAIIRNGSYYRISSYQENKEYDCWEIVSESENEVLVVFTQVLGRPNYHGRLLKLQGLEPNAMYQIDESDTVYSGDILMYAGFPMADLWGDFRSRLLVLKKV